MCILRDDSHCCTAETNPALYSNYSPLKFFFKVKKITNYPFKRKA